MDTVKILDEPVKDKTTGKKWVTISISNDAVKFISEVTGHYLEHKMGDVDDTKYMAIALQFKEDILKIRDKLNPS